MISVTNIQQFVNAGKAKKVAITAVMRRIIVLANTLLRVKDAIGNLFALDQDGLAHLP
jgi:hypothetical protein